MTNECAIDRVCDETPRHLSSGCLPHCAVNAASCSDTAHAVPCAWETKLAKGRAQGDEQKLKKALAHTLSWPYLAKGVHAPNEKYLHWNTHRLPHLARLLVLARYSNIHHAY
jgi:hypothetical protein